jgi:hypothetical protein
MSGWCTFWSNRSKSHQRSRTGRTALDDAASSSLGRDHILLARHFGWTPEQVAQLTPAQVGVYLAGIEKLLAMDSRST